MKEQNGYRIKEYKEESKYYERKEVLRCLEIYGQMIHLRSFFPGGAKYEESRELVKKTIRDAKTIIPSELKNEKFDKVLTELEKIVKGLPYNS